VQKNLLKKKMFYIHIYVLAYFTHFENAYAAKISFRLSKSEGPAKTFSDLIGEHQSPSDNVKINHYLFRPGPRFFFYKRY